MNYTAVDLYRKWRAQKRRPSLTQKSGWHVPRPPGFAPMLSTTVSSYSTNWTDFTNSLIIYFCFLIVFNCFCFNVFVSPGAFGVVRWTKAVTYQFWTRVKCLSCFPIFVCLYMSRSTIGPRYCRDRIFTPTINPILIRIPAAADIASRERWDLDSVCYAHARWKSSILLSRLFGKRSANAFGVERTIARLTFFGGKN